MLDVKSNQPNNVRFRAYQFSLAIIRLVQDFPNNKIYWIFTDQLLRAATSIGANLIEAKSSSSKKDFARFYEIALKSASETQYWLCLLSDGKLVAEDKIGILVKEVEEISKMIGSSLLTMRGKR
jgi:four helix bundle protein